MYGYIYGKMTINSHNSIKSIKYEWSFTKMHSGIKYNLTKIKDHIPRNTASHGPIANAILQYKSLSPDVQFHQIWSCINLCITSRLDTNSHIYVWMYGLEKGHKNRLREQNAHDRFSVIFTKEISFMTFCLVIPSTKPFLKEVCFWKERICSPILTF